MKWRPVRWLAGLDENTKEAVCIASWVLLALIAYMAMSSGALVISCSAAAALLTVALGYWDQPSVSNKRVAITLTVAVTLFGSYAAIQSAKESAQQALEAAALAKEIHQISERTSKNLDSAGRRFDDVATKFGLQISDLQTVTGDIKGSAAESLNNLTGGDSFAYVIPDVGLPGELVRLILRNQGRYPLQGVSVDIRELEVQGRSFRTAPITLAAGGVLPLKETLDAPPRTGVSMWQLIVYSQARPIHQSVALRCDADGWPEFRINVVRADFPKAPPKSVGDGGFGSTVKTKDSLVWTDWSESLMRKTRRLSEEAQKKRQ
jgi:hypothetical protein